MRARDKNFNAEIKTDFDATIGKINVIPWDIGRVMLNLYNNALYVVMEKKRQGVCFNCNKPGHISKNCNEPRKPITCNTCGKKGHMAKQCWGKEYNNRNNSSNNYNNNNNRNNNNYRNNFDNNRNNNVRQGTSQMKNINGRPVRVFYVEEDEIEEENNNDNNNDNNNQQLVNMMDQLLSKKLKSLKD
jgi:hypothetical protein